MTAQTLCAPGTVHLKNGFELRYLRHETRGEAQRLYLSAGGYIDVAAASIENLEDDATPAAPCPAEASATAPAEGDGAANPNGTRKPPDNGPGAAAASLDEHLAHASDESGIDEDFLRSVIRQESGFNPQAISPKGARGLMQLMPQTAKALGVENAFDTAANLRGGSQYLRDLLLRYHGDAAKALAAYNAGPGAVERFGGIPPYRETQQYIARVINDYNRRKIQEERAAAQPPTMVAANSAPARRRKPAQRTKRKAERGKG